MSTGKTGGAQPSVLYATQRTMDSCVRGLIEDATSYDVMTFRGSLLRLPK